MGARWMPGKLTLVMLTVSTVCLLVAGVGRAQSTWVDEIANSLTFYKANYPSSNWEPYQQKLTTVREALGRGDQR
ncbi:MAG: hypothetical protein ACREI2_15550, partial [Nitrospiraceae bacterium]